MPSRWGRLLEAFLTSRISQGTDADAARDRALDLPCTRNTFWSQAGFAGWVAGISCRSTRCPYPDKPNWNEPRRLPLGLVCENVSPKSRDGILGGHSLLWRGCGFAED
jgi:hypothetical protein